MGIMVYSLLWVMQDLYHQPCLSRAAPVVELVSEETMLVTLLP